MGSSFNGPPNPNNQPFGDTNAGDISGPPNPQNATAEDPERDSLEELLDKKTGAAAGE